MRNLVDAAFEYIAPVAAMRRHAARTAMRVLNTGYSEGGASSKKTSFRGWNWRGGSVREDVNKNVQTLQQRSRDLWMNTGIGCAALGRTEINVIGTGLRLRASPDAEVLGLEMDAARAWARSTEREFLLWANSRDCDNTGLNDFSELQQQAFLSWLMSGDVFALLPDIEPISQPYGLCVQLVEADRVTNPSGKDSDSKFHNGVETDARGRVIAYHVRSSHPLAQAGMGQTTFTRVPVRGDSGRLNILHLIVTKRPEQYRGVPILAPVIENIKQISRYGDAELMAAVVSAMMTVFIKSETPDTPLGESIYPQTADEQYDPDAGFRYELGAGAIVGLNKGEEIQTFNPSRPNSQFDAFLASMAKQIGAALDIPGELLLLQFTSSYSASRAALLEAWKGFRRWRAWMANDFCQPIYSEWLVEAILLGRVKAQGFFDDDVIRAAWTRALWHGPSPGQIDALKEVQAAGERIDRGLSTHAREALEITGTDFDANVHEQFTERQMLTEAGIPGVGSTAGVVIPGEQQQQ